MYCLNKNAEIFFLIFEILSILCLSITEGRALEGDGSCLSNGGNCQLITVPCIEGTVVESDECDEERMCCVPLNGNRNVLPLVQHETVVIQTAAKQDLQNCLPLLTETHQNAPISNPTGHYGDGCGLIPALSESQSDTGFRIVGGVFSTPGKWPWQVAIQTSTCHHLCGASLLSAQWVITAAHCVLNYLDKVSELRAVMGEHDRSMAEGTEVITGISNIILHPLFRQAYNFPNDVALLKLNESISVNGTYVRRVCLPGWTQEFMHRECYVTGWGFTADTGKSAVLKQVQVDMVPLARCRQMWGDGILETNLCAGNGRTGACEGDSGGPLVCSVDDVFILAGVISWGAVTCNEDSHPNVFTSVPMVMDWINQTISAA